MKERGYGWSGFTLAFLRSKMAEARAPWPPAPMALFTSPPRKLLPPRAPLTSKRYFPSSRICGCVKEAGQVAVTSGCKSVGTVEVEGCQRQDLRDGPQCRRMALQAQPQWCWPMGPFELCARPHLDALHAILNAEVPRVVLVIRLALLLPGAVAPAGAAIIEHHRLRQHELSAWEAQVVEKGIGAKGEMPQMVHVRMYRVGSLRACG